MNSIVQTSPPVFSVPVRWTLRLLAWLAFLVTAYLAWHTVGQTSLAGCGVGSGTGCDLVLSSKWSKWLGVPVSILGLACYASLAGLSVLLGLQNARPGRWVNTAFLLLATFAAFASLWFIAIQVIALRSICPYCVVVDLCGIGLGALALWSSVRWLRATRHLRRTFTANAGLASLRSALPTAGRASQVVTPPVRSWPTPSLPLALGGAATLLLVFLGVQVLFPTQTYHVQQVVLNDSVKLVGSQDGNGEAEPSREAESHVAMRVPSESEAIVDEKITEEPPTLEQHGEAKPQDNEEPTTTAVGEPSNGTDSQVEPSVPSPPVTGPRRERLVTFLGGKLTLDVYKHPILGSPEAPHVLIEMVSYDCIHCRKAHRLVKQAQARYGNQVAIIIMVIPLERDCNRLVTNAAASHPGACSIARMALGVATLKPTAFARFHDWLMSNEKRPPRPEQVVARAYSLADRNRLRELSTSQEMAKQIAQYVDLYAMLLNQNASNKSFGLPVQILGDHVLSGSVEKPEDIYRAWEEHLGLKPR